VQFRLLNYLLLCVQMMRKKMMMMKL